MSRRQSKIDEGCELGAIGCALGFVFINVAIPVLLFILLVMSLIRKCS